MVRARNSEKTSLTRIKSKVTLLTALIDDVKKDSSDYY